MDLTRARRALATLTCCLWVANCGGEAADPAQDVGADTSTGDTSTGDTSAPSDAAAETGTAPSDAAAAADGTAQPDAGRAPATAKAPSALTYATPKPWAKPIEDYIAAGFADQKSYDFKRQIHDLAPHDGRLYVAYGDADKNLGRIFDITMRAFTSPDSTEIKDEFKSTEEQIDRYRTLGDELWVAGVDATEDGWLGNVFHLKPKGAWVRRRTVTGGVHVHDVTRHDGAVWAVGSGATQAQWKQGDIYAHLWRSSDEGQAFEIAAQSWNNGEGDARWVHLLPTSGGLLVFGYKINKQGKLSELPHGVATLTTGGGGKAQVVPLAPDHPLKNVHVIGCWPDGQGGGVITGIDVLQSPQTLAAWSVTGTDAKSAVPLGLKDRSVIDVHVHRPSGETLVLSRAGAAWPPKKSGETWAIQVHLSPDRKSWTTVLDFPSGDLPTAIAWWAGHLHIGSELGDVWRAEGSFARP